MTVKELIEELKEYNPNAKVKVAVDDSDGCDIATTEIYKSNSNGAFSEKIICLVGITED